MEEKTSNKKLIWYILFAVVTVVLCDLFIVVYFYYISPYNISLKLTLWPFVSEQTAGEMYQDATVEINFVVEDEFTFEEVEESVVGVNVSRDGYVLAPYHMFKDCKGDTTFKILTNAGNVFKGELIFAEENYDIAIFKCESLTENTEKIKLPYVFIESVSSIYEKDKVVAVASPIKTGQVCSGTVTELGLVDSKLTEYENRIGVEYIIQDCFSMKLQSTTFEGGVIFNENGSVLGFCYAGTNVAGTCKAMPVGGAKLFLSDAIEAYEKGNMFSNDFANSFVGIDKIETAYHISASNQNEVENNQQYFYFQEAWYTISEDLKYYNRQMVVEGFYLLEDLEYNSDVVLNAKSVIHSIKLNGKTYKIKSKSDLYDLCYKLESGNKITIFYYPEIENISSILSQKVVTI